jgi:hypothetical protein
LLPTQPAIATNFDWRTFSLHPVKRLADVALFREQPFLSAVLPMYVLFALCVPLVVPMARRTPAVVLFGSLAVWLVAPWLGEHLPDADGGGWPFNPFAWQLMFTFGVLGRLHPVLADEQSSKAASRLTRAALVVALTFALVKLCIDDHPSPGYMKQNLASLRVVSFLSLAWLCAQAVRRGWLRALADRLPAVVTVGRQGLVCFVGGTLVSIGADTALQLVHVRTAQPLSDWPVRLLSDALAIAALLLLARVAARLKTTRMQSAAIPPAMALARASVRDGDTRRERRD